MERRKGSFQRPAEAGRGHLAMFITELIKGRPVTRRRDDQTLDWAHVRLRGLEAQKDGGDKSTGS